jgi:uncharacterized damage-inducible protein DinB
MRDALVQALVAHFDSVFEGPNGDYPAVLEALDGLTAAQAAWKPGPEHNSIWQIVDHLTASKIWQIDLLEKGKATSPVWTQPSGTKSAWQASLTKLKDAHTLLLMALGRLAGIDLLGVPTPESKQTQLELLLSIAAHEAHHSGQIDYLRGLQRAQAAT